MSPQSSGDPTPSRAEITMTQAIVDVAKPPGIAAHEHIIVGKDGTPALSRPVLTQGRPFVGGLVSAALNS